VGGGFLGGLTSFGTLRSWEAVQLLLRDGRPDGMVGYLLASYATGVALATVATCCPPPRCLRRRRAPKLCPR
jgi:fluoride ion exporter CrcB/FEX